MGAFLFLAFRNVDGTISCVTPSPTSTSAGSCPPIAISLLMQVFRAWRWQLELRPLARVPFAHALGGGERRLHGDQPAARPDGRGGAPVAAVAALDVSFSNVVGNLIVEKTVDSAVIVFYILLGLLTTENLPVWVRRGAAVPAVGFVALALARRAALVARRGGRRALGRALAAGALPHAGSSAWRAPWSTACASSVIRAWSSRCSPSRSCSGSIPILSSWVMIRAFHLDVPFNAALAVFILIGFGTALPQLPGMIGTLPVACVSRSASSASRSPRRWPTASC